MIRLFFQLINDIGQDYKTRIISLFFLSILAGIMEVMGIALIFPLIQLVNSPEIVETNGYLTDLYEALGFENPISMVYFIAVTIGAIFILKNLYMIWFNHMQLTLVRQWRNDICAKMMDRYLKAPYSYHLGRASGNMINTLNHTVTFVLNSYVFSFISMLSHIVVAVMLLAFLMVQFLIPSIVSGVLLVVLMVIQAKSIRHHSSLISQNINEANAQNLMVLTQGIVAVKETKAFMREPYFLDRYDTSNQTVSAYDKKMIFLQQLPSYVSEIVLVVAIIVMSCLMLSQTYSPMDGMMSLAVLAAVAFRMAPMMNRSLYCYSQIRASSGSGVKLREEIKELDQLDVEPFIETVTPLPFTKELRFENVCFNYNEKTPALKDVNLTIQKGEFIGIIGPSGAGKTTLVDIMLGLLRPSSGLYTADDTAINSSERLRSLRAISGYVSQTPYIFNGSVRENVAFGIPSEEIDDQRVIEVLKMAQIDSFFKTRDGYIDAAIGDNGRSLSGGQRQRLAIARALYHNPEIIVMDEATSALDVETEYEITQVVNKLKGSKTIIAIAHRLSTLKECDRLILMEDGYIIDVGTFAELENRHTRFSRLLELSSIK